MRRVIIVDFANLRDGRPGHLRGHRIREDGSLKNFSYADWKYISSAIGHLRAAAPGSVIYLVSERSMQYEFLKGQKGAERLNAAVELPCDEFWHMYMMKTRSEQAGLRGDYDTRSNKGVRADDLILHLAAKLDGFVLSSDFFRQPEYQEVLGQIDHRVFYPTLSLDGKQWHFADSRQMEQITYPERFARVGQLRSIEEVIASAPQYSEAEIRDIQEQICGEGGLIDEFWSDYVAQHGVTPIKRARRSPRVPRSTRPAPSLKPGLTSTPFGRLGELVGILPPSNDGIDENAKLPLVLAIQTKRLQNLEGRGVIVVGRLRSEQNNRYLEWYPGDRRIQLAASRDLTLASEREFVGIKGRIRAKDKRFVLEVPDSAIVQVFSFAEANSMLIDDISEFPALLPRRWSLPRLPGRRPAGTVPRPRPTTPPPGPAQVPVTPSVPPLPAGITDVPEPSRINARLAVSIAIGVAVVTTVAGLLIAFLK